MGFNKTHIVINPAYEHLRNWIVSLPEIFEHEGEIIYNDRNQIRTMKIGNQDVVVKRFRKPRFFNRIAYTLFRQPKAVRSYDNTQILQQRGINTPTPIAYIIEYSHGLIAQSYLITEKSKLTHTFYDFRDGITKGKEGLIEAMVDFTINMNNQGVFHLDYSPGNILYDNIDGKWTFDIIDINRMEFGKVSMQKGCSQYERLWGKRIFFEIIAKRYSEITKSDYTVCLEYIMAARSKFWKHRSTEHFITDESFTIGVIISTYNNPQWLEKVFWGLMNQTHKADEIIIADDGSTKETQQLIERYKDKLPLQHVWHEDKGFRKTTILNKAVTQSRVDYLIFLDQDLIPRQDFISTHYRNAKENRFISGGANMITEELSNSITEDDVRNGNIFSISWLLKHGMKWSHKLLKLTSVRWFAKLMNHLTTTKATWNGGNASTWRKYIIDANGFDTRMRYGAEDREFGERLINRGIKGVQLRYSLPLIHLYHKRPYKNKEDWERNMIIWKETKKNKITKTKYGIE